MKTKEELVSEFSDELIGLLLRSFAAEEMCGGKLNTEDRGRFFKQSVAKGVELLKEIHDFICKDESHVPAKVGTAATPVQPPPTNGKHTPLPVRR